MWRTARDNVAGKSNNYFKCVPASCAAEWAAASREDSRLITHTVQDDIPK
jgi:hypothetical protein